MRASLRTSTSACIGALAALMTALPLYFYFPLVPYLRFELAEIPVMLGFFLLGPESAVLSSFIYWGVLLLVGEYSPIGPTMKLVAVVSMVLGLWLGFKLDRGLRTKLLVGSCLGCLFRVLSMTAFNYVIIAVMFPGFLETAAAAISTALGIRFSSDLAALIVVIILTAFFNVLHTLLSIAPAYLLVKAVVRAGGEESVIRNSWYAELVRAASRQAPRRS